MDIFFDNQTQYLRYPVYFFTKVKHNKIHTFVNALILVIP